MCFSKDALFSFTRFVIEVELSSLKSTFTFQAGIFLINREKGVLGYKAVPLLYFSLARRAAL